jgi:hypothetical protein
MKFGADTSPPHDDTAIIQAEAQATVGKGTVCDVWVDLIRFVLEARRPPQSPEPRPWGCRGDYDSV